jgi:hypothetical protein
MMDARGLRLLAQDAEGLQILAAAVQDALVKPSDMKRDTRSRTFGFEMSRFQWEAAGKRAPFFRTRSILAFSSVHMARATGLPRTGEDALVLLDLAFIPSADTPAGEIRLVFAGGGEMRLGVECIDATLIDTGPSWPTRRKPDHERRK